MISSPLRLIVFHLVGKLLVSPSGIQSKGVLEKENDFVGY